MFLTVTICVSDSSNERNKQYYVKIMLDDKQSIITPKKNLGLCFLNCHKFIILWLWNLEMEGLQKHPTTAAQQKVLGTEYLSIQAYH